MIYSPNNSTLQMSLFRAITKKNPKNKNQNKKQKTPVGLP